MPISASALACEIPDWSAESNFGQISKTVELPGFGLITEALTNTPLFQTNFFPLFIQVNFLPFTIDVVFSFEQVAPAFAVAALA
jgi:hypothetical protein